MWRAEAVLGDHATRTTSSSSRGRKALYQHFRESLMGNATITVVLDRRRGDRRVATTGPGGRATTRRATLARHRD
jgi:hypothetical protein